MENTILSLLLAFSFQSVKELPHCTYRNNGTIVWWETRHVFCQCDASTGQWLTIKKGLR